MGEPEDEGAGDPQVSEDEKTVGEQVVIDHMLDDRKSSLAERIDDAIADRDAEWQAALVKLFQAQNPGQAEEAVQNFLSSQEITIQAHESRIADELERVADRIRRQKI